MQEVERISGALQQRERVGGPSSAAVASRSKYRRFWESRFEELVSALERAVRGEDVPLDVAAIRSIGSRKSWYGTVRVRDCEVLEGKGDLAAHTKALGYPSRCTSAIAIPLSPATAYNRKMRSLAASSKMAGSRSWLTWP